MTPALLFCFYLTKKLPLQKSSLNQDSRRIQKPASRLSFRQLLIQQLRCAIKQRKRSSSHMHTEITSETEQSQKAERKLVKNDVMLGIEVVYGAFAFLLLLGLFFSMIVIVISKLPVPEHFNLGYLALTLGGVTAAVLLYLILPVFGIILLVTVLLGIVIALASSSWTVG